MNIAYVNYKNALWLVICTVINKPITRTCRHRLDIIDTPCILELVHTGIYRVQP